MMDPSRGLRLTLERWGIGAAGFWCVRPRVVRDFSWFQMVIGFLVCLANLFSFCLVPFREVRTILFRLEI